MLSETIDTPTADWTNTYLYGLGILGQQNGSTWSTFGADPLGSVRFLIDNTGEIASRADYDPYGVPLPVPGQESGMDTALGFTGEQTDPFGLVNLRARTYNPRLGTFTSVDPVLGVGGSTGWNGYLYANGNPANLTDPSGACIGPLTFLLPACIAAVVGVGYGAFTGARRWDIAHDCQCGDPYSLKTDRTHYILESMFKGGAAGAVGAVVLTLAPWAALPTAVVGVGLSGIQAASHWNPSNPYEQFERDEGILGTILGSIALPFAARHTSDALLNSQLSKLAATDPLFHPDVIYPQIQRGFLGRISEDTLAFLGFYPQADNYIETIRAYRFSDRKDTSSLLPRVYKNPIMRPLVALGMKFRWFRSLRAELHSDGITFASPYVSLGTDLQAMLSTRDEWLQSIMTGIPNLAQRAPDIGIFNIPVNRITYPRFTVGVRESEIMFRGNDLLKFLIEWNENPYGKTNPK